MVFAGTAAPDADRSCELLAFSETRRSYTLRFHGDPLGSCRIGDIGAADLLQTVEIELLNPVFANESAQQVRHHLGMGKQ